MAHKKNLVLQEYCGTTYAVPCQGNQQETIERVKREVPAVEVVASNEKKRLQSELADVKQQHQATLKKLTAADELAKNQLVPSTSNEPILLNLNPCCLTYPLTHSKD